MGSQKKESRFTMQFTLTPVGNFADRRTLVVRSSEAVTIGRVSRLSRKPSHRLEASPSNALFDCGVVSRTHATIQFNPWAPEQDQITLTDQFSTHGTYVNRVKLMPGREMVLRSGDLIKLGEEIERDAEVFRPIKVIFQQNTPDPTSHATKVPDAKKRSQGFHVSVPSDRGSSDEDDGSSVGSSFRYLAASSADTTPEKPKGPDGTKGQPIDVDGGPRPLPTFTELAGNDPSRSSSHRPPAIAEFLSSELRNTKTEPFAETHAAGGEVEESLYDEIHEDVIPETFHVVQEPCGTDTSHWSAQDYSISASAAIEITKTDDTVNKAADNRQPSGTIDDNVVLTDDDIDGGSDDEGPEVESSQAPAGIPNADSSSPVAFSDRIPTDSAGHAISHVPGRPRYDPVRGSPSPVMPKQGTSAAHTSAQPAGEWSGTLPFPASFEIGGVVCPSYTYADIFTPVQYPGKAVRGRASPSFPTLDHSSWTAPPEIGAPQTLAGVEAHMYDMMQPASAQRMSIYDIVNQPQPDTFDALHTPQRSQPVDVKVLANSDEQNVAATPEIPAQVGQKRKRSDVGDSEPIIESSEEADNSAVIEPSTVRPTKRPRNDGAAPASSLRRYLTNVACVALGVVGTHLFYESPLSEKLIELLS